MIRYQRIKLKLLLPDLVDPHDQCVQRLREMLESKLGIDGAHLVESTETEPLQFCIHFDPEKISVGQVIEFAKRTGADLASQFGHVLVRYDATYARRASAVEASLAKKKGILECTVAPDGTVRIEFDRHWTNEAQIRQELSRWLKLEPEHIEASAVPAGTPTPALQNQHQTGHTHDDKLDRDSHGNADPRHRNGEITPLGIFGKRTELIFALLCGVFMLVGWVLERFTESQKFLPIAFFVASYGLGGFFTLIEAYEKLRVGKFEIDFLMLVAAAGAASLGAWAEGSLLLFLFSLGHALEGYAMGRAKQAIEALAGIAPKTARVRRDGIEFDVAVEQLQVGDTVIIKPDERIPTDGFVTSGESSIDQSPITGESVPVDKSPVPDVAQAAADPESVTADSRLFAGTINQSGLLAMYVTRIHSETTLSRVVKMVGEAETRISPTQHFTKRFERYFVPAVIGFVILLMFAPLVVNEPFSKSFYRAMAVLVASSPCALAISTPAAVLSGIARAARGGVLIKGGGPLENLGRLDTFAFDKTGTLTEGEPRLTDVKTLDGTDETTLLRIAIAVEEFSKHPLAKAIVRDGKQRLVEIAKVDDTPKQHLEATDMHSITGRGIRASVDGHDVYIGKANLFTELGNGGLPESVKRVDDELKMQGRTTMVVRRGNQFLGVLGVMDTPREAAKSTIKKLRELGVKRMLMISGDNQMVANAVAAEVGLDEARGDLLPEDKVREIKKLSGELSGVAMIGDGVNDAPAMANATVGIAMGAAGSDVALETADIALMADNLNHLPFAVGLSRATNRIIRQNLWISLGMVVVLIPLTLLGLSLGPAVFLHEGSTVVVVFNALRLLGYRAS